jgi:two-component system phosphate regulon sensor histidine kinase PhoR
VDLDDGLNIRGEERELYSAFSNLISNACKYTPRGGRITICWQQMGVGEAGFSVQDSGVGIDRIHIPHLTERFYRVDKSRSISSGGTGLGLAIVKHVLLRHDAQLRIDSQPGEGSCFTAVFGAKSVLR